MEIDSIEEWKTDSFTKVMAYIRYSSKRVANCLLKVNNLQYPPHAAPLPVSVVQPPVSRNKTRATATLSLARKQNQTTLAHTQRDKHTQAHLSATQIFQRRASPVITVYCPFQMSEFWGRST